MSPREYRRWWDVPVSILGALVVAIGSALLLALWDAPGWAWGLWVLGSYRITP